MTAARTTYDEHGRELSYRDTDGTGWDYTRDEHGRVLSFRRTDGTGWDYTRDEHGRVLSYRHTDGTGWDAIAHDTEYTLHRNTDGTYSAGRRDGLTLAQARKHWGPPRTDARATLFTAALAKEKTMTTETITRIAEFEARLPSSHTTYEHGDLSVAGFEITTTAQTVRLYIANGQSCCENFGYFMTQDNLDDFIGAELLDIKVVDSDLKHPKLRRPADASYAPGECFIHDGDTMFVNIETSKGLLQFVAYNEHNGYYSHHAGVVSTMLKHGTRL